MKITLQIDTKNTVELTEAINFLNGFTKLTHNEPEVKVEAPKKEKVTPSIPKEKKAVEAPVEKKVEAPKPSITLQTLKDSAKDATLRVDREQVKKAILEFAPKLAEVKDADFGKLYKKLEELGK